MSERDAVMADLKKSVETWDMALVEKSVKAALLLDITPTDIIKDGLGRGMVEIGNRFNKAEIYLPQVVAASKTMELALKILKPVMECGNSPLRGCIIMGSVQGDIHEIGKNVCCAMLRGAGFEVIDIGSDRSCDDFLEAADSNNSSIIGASALMTTTLVAQKDLVSLIKEEGRPYFILVGGAPCSQQWCDEIGASGYSDSAAEIVKLVETLLTEKSKL